MPDNVGVQSQEMTIKDKVNVNITGKTFKDFVIECAQRLFVNTNFDWENKRSNEQIARDCIGRAIVLANLLYSDGWLDKN